MDGKIGKRHLIQAAFLAALLLGPCRGGCGLPTVLRAGDQRETSVACAKENSANTRTVSKTYRTSLVGDITDGVKRSSPIDVIELLPPPEHMAGASGALTLGDLEGIALANHPTLSATRARIESARGRRLQAGLYPNPVAGYHATEVGNEGTAGQQGGIVNQRVITAGKLGLDQAIVGREVMALRYQLQANEQRVLSDVRIRFFEALAAQQRVALTHELVRIGKELVRATEQLTEGRLGTENDLLQAQIRAEESYILRDNARNERFESWWRLATVTGVPSMQMVQLHGELELDLPQLGWEDCLAMVLNGNPELNAARTRVQQAAIVVQRERREPIPNIDLSASVRHHNVTSDDVANVQIGIPIPIFDKNQGNIRSAESQWIAARAEVERMKLEIQDRLAVAYRRYANARQQAERYGHQIVPRSKRSLELVTAGYEQGQVEYLMLLTAQETFFRSSLAHLDALREFWTALALIDGQLLVGSLAVSGS